MRPIQCSTIIAAVALFLTAGGEAAEDAPFELEPGFTAFFNGTDLTGWKSNKGGEPLDGKTATANQRFQVQDGVLVIDGKVRGNQVIDTAHEFAGDVHIKFEYRPGPGCNNDLYFRGLKFDIKKGDVKNYSEGEWHTFEILVRGDNVEFRSDGETQRKQTAKTERSPLGIRAEFGSIEFRRMRYGK